MLFRYIRCMFLERMKNLTIIKLQQLRFIPKKYKYRPILLKLLFHILNNILKMTLPITNNRLKYPPILSFIPID